MGNGDDHDNDEIFVIRIHTTQERGLHWCGSIDPTSCKWDLESDLKKKKDPFVLLRDSVRSGVHHFPYLSSIPPQAQLHLSVYVWSISHKLSTTNSLACSEVFVTS